MGKPVVRVMRRIGRRIVSVNDVKKIGEKTLLAAGCPRAELSIVLCDDAFIRNLNRDFRGQDQSTDVLSFAMNDGETLNPHPELLGDVVISLETAQKQAAQNGISALEEVAELIVHGVLHLLGYDHEKRGDAACMTKEAKRIHAVIKSSL